MNITVTQIEPDFTITQIDTGSTVTLPSGIAINVALPGSIAGPAGPQGPAGPAGPQGPPGITPFAFSQALASATWTVAHGLETYPSVVVLDSAGQMIEGDVTYNDANTVTLNFSAAFSGVAYLI